MSTDVVTIDHETGELLPDERESGGLALSVDETVRLLELVHEAKRRVLHEGRGGDYWRIPGTGDKPTLLKPGAEKLLQFFRYRVSAMTRTETQTQPNFGCAYECRIENPNGQTVAVCEGWADQGEPGMKNKDGSLRPRNAVMKMAQKRAMVGAVLNACAASALFTQDIEDHQVPGDPSPPETPGTGRAPARGRHAGGASATQQPASSTKSPGAPPAAGNQGSAAGATERPVPAAEPLSPGKAQFLTLMEELGIENQRTNRAHAIKALTAHNITSDLLTDRAKVAEAREALRVAFAIPRTASQIVEVPSDRDDGTKYKVTLSRRDADTDAACECEAFKFHGLCKHASSAWSQLGLGDLVDPPIPLEPWEGIDLLEQAMAAGAAYEAAFPEAAAKRKGRKLSAKDEDVADKAFGDEPAPAPEAA